MSFSSDTLAVPAWSAHTGRAPSQWRPRHGTTLLVSPCRRLATGALCGAEIAQAGERPGMADATSNAWLLRAACLEGIDWPGLGVTVALPPGSIRAGTLLAQAEAALLGARLLPGGLTVALAEADLADGRPELLLLVSALRDLGVGVSIDMQARVEDGLRILRRLPLTAVRLPPALVQDAAQNPDARRSLARIIGLSHAVEASAVAVGVENALQRDILADLRCDTALGPLFGCNLPACAFRMALAA